MADDVVVGGGPSSAGSGVRSALGAASGRGLSHEGAERVRDVLRAPGRPLDPESREHFEPRIGEDLSRVRVHDDRRSARSAAGLGARAYAVGRHVVFGTGEHAPHTDRGRGLLAHEVVHAVQVPAPSRAPTVVSRWEHSEKGGLTKGARHWRRSDRVGRTKRWKAACEHNLLHVNAGDYRQIEERRDFYRWFYEATAARGYHTRWALAAYVVAGGMAEMAAVDWSEGASPITNELQGLARIGNQVIFDDVLPKLKALWENGPLKGRDARRKDAEILAEEQHLVQAMYKGLSKDTMKRFQRIADNDYARTQVGRAIGLGGSVAKGPYNRGGDVPAFSGDSGIIPKGDIRRPEDRWVYGMALGAHFSTLPGYGSPGAMPSAGKAYTSGAQYARLNVRPNLHMLDAVLNDADVPETSVVKLLQRLNATEQSELQLSTWRIDRMKGALSLDEMVRGVGKLAGISLFDKMMLFGGAVGYDDWEDIDYDDIQAVVRRSPGGERRALHSDYWMGVFVDICTDATIRPAVVDLLLPPATAKRWIEEEEGF